VALATWFALGALSGSTPLADGITAGLCLQYSWFRAVHRRMHRPGHAMSRGARAHFHRGHHADAGCNFGVTTLLWDSLFRSRYVAPREQSVI
jgi:sterol desaturase/sphingolipid hydroxylase (fatty acid hydroxylase superfamily)